MTTPENTENNDFAVGAVPLARIKKKGRSKARIIVPIVVVIVIILALVAYFGLRSSAEHHLSSNDLTTSSTGDISQTINLNGTVEPKQTATLTTTLTTKATAVNVESGSRVKQGDILVSLDVSDTQRDLDSKTAALDASKRADMLAAQQAQQALDQANSGDSSDLRNAEASLRNATDTYTNAKVDLDRALRHRASGLDSSANALNQLNATRANVILAALDALNSGASNVDNIRGLISGTVDSATLGAATTVGTALWKVNEASKAATDAETAFNQSIVDADEEIQKSKRSVDAAYQGVLDAQFGLEQAKTAAKNNRDNLQLQADNAWAKVNDDSDDKSLDSIRLQIADKDIKAPFDGVVTSVSASKDNPVNGQVATVADDSTLIIKGKLKESDFSKVKEGAEVTFTSVVAPDKTFTGKVSKITNVPEMTTVQSTGSGVSSLLSGGSASSSDTRAEYPIEVEVTGDHDGLNLGASAKMKISTQSATNVLKVPNAALVQGDNDDERYVYVLNDQDVIERRTVKAGFTNGVETAITEGDLKSGERIISYPSTYESLVGKHVKVDA
ncbi:MAG: HlyD family efflux transporter periplasmic adaptor subunit [Corynebacterium sp.]|nr:HlyD family efflux transporter periplasmic adaptor subunit [Corynebacterium sp.]